MAVASCMRRAGHSLGSQLCRRWLHAAATAAAATADELIAAARHLPARVLDGRAVAAAWQEELAASVADVVARGGRPPGLGVVLVGTRPDSQLYVGRKREACDKVGMFTEVRQLSSSVTQRQLEAAVAALCADPRIDGVLVQLPLPRHLDEEAVIERFDPAKDVDGFHPLNMGRILMRGRAARFVPCTALGVIELLQRSGVPIQGRNVVVMGDSNIVGMPLAMLFRDAGAATVTVLHRTSYRELFADAASAERARERAAAEACLPRIPGPVAAHAVGLQAAGSSEQQQQQSTQPQQQEQQQQAEQGQPGQQAGHPYTVDYSSTLRDAFARPAPQQQQQQQQQEQEQEQEQEQQRQQAASAAPARGDGGVLYRGLSELPRITRTADILVVAVGFPRLVRKEWVKRGAVVVDVGINVVGRVGGAPLAGDGLSEEDAQPFHVVGDVDFCDVAEVAAALTPVPGGVGPMTIAAVLHNTVQAARSNLGLEA